MSKFGKLTYAQKKCVALVGLCMQRTGMLRPGDRIGVAVSGGVDSFVLLKALLIRQAIVPFPFEIMALHVNPGFSPDSHQALTDWSRRKAWLCMRNSRTSAPAPTPRRTARIPPAFIAPCCAANVCSASARTTA
jgi:Predicted ATPase of the PP-loop superfamily implicated in cell cycle control